MIEWLREHLCPRNNRGPEIPKIARCHVCAIKDVESPQFRIRQGDILRVSDITNGLTLFAENIFTRRCGYINASDITKKPEESFILASWRDIDKSEAARLLANPAIDPGTFILCSESENNGLALMIRTDNKLSVKIYEIYPNQSNQYCIKGQFPFDRLTDLLEYCSENPIDSAYNRLIPYGEFPTLTESITEDQFSNVYLGTWQDKKVSVKALKPKSPVSVLLQNIQYLKRIHHPACVRTLEIAYQWTSINSTMIMIIMDPFEGRTLKNFLSSSDSHFLNFDGLLKIYTEISEGMEYLERHGIVHSNLNDRHILHGSIGQIKITDIGIRSLLTKSNEFSPEWFPFDYWSAPEFAEDPRAFTHKSDIWAFGILGFVIFNRGEEPYKNVPVDTLPNFIQNGNYPTSSKKEFNNILPVLKFCWQIYPEDRQTFAKITMWLKEEEFQKYANFAVDSKNL
ncbi:unnamed protein product [Hymenolepis diminuta]|uniref:Tyrosine-protein kinase n=1 Tax=Hymenolepis diminuta TaxID=6216 RepID=A0A564Y6P1_HYMDI|nr:unnamed protein product [Hymenolepis diminuta]